MVKSSVEGRCQHYTTSSITTITVVRDDAWFTWIGNFPSTSIILSLIFVQKSCIASFNSKRVLFTNAYFASHTRTHTHYTSCVTFLITSTSLWLLGYVMLMGDGIHSQRAYIFAVILIVVWKLGIETFACVFCVCVSWATYRFNAMNMLYTSSFIGRHCNCILCGGWNMDGLASDSTIFRSMAKLWYGWQLCTTAPPKRCSSLQLFRKLQIYYGK